MKNSETFHFADDTCLLNIQENKQSSQQGSEVSDPMATCKQISLKVAKAENIIFRRKKKQLNFDLNLKVCGKNPKHQVMWNI